MSPEFVENQMRRLGVLRFPPADISEHRAALEDIPADVLDAAVSHALKTRTVFPVPSELRADADLVRSQVRPASVAEDRSVALPEPFTITVPEVGTVVSITREWKYYCDTCSDSGWDSIWCGGENDKCRKPWQPVQRCERREDHDPHEWVQHCVCFNTNPALVRKRNAAQKFAEKPQKVA